MPWPLSQTQPLQPEHCSFATAHLLAGTGTFTDEGAKRERLGSAPVDALARLYHCAPLIVDALHAAVQVEVLRDLRDRIANLPQGSCRC